MSRLPDPPMTTPPARRHPSAAPRLMRLALKESREILRDRRTVITLVLMPVLIYPLLALVFQKFLMTSMTDPQGVQYLIGVSSETQGKRLLRQVLRGDALLKQEGEQDADANSDIPPQWRIADPDLLERSVAEGRLDAAVVEVEPNDSDATPGSGSTSHWDLMYRRGSVISEGALDYLEDRLNAYSDEVLARKLAPLGLDLQRPVDTDRIAIESVVTPVFSLAALVPLILILMTITGAVYPAIDLTAGERERGTLETLIAAPVPRLGLLLAKYTAVLIVALLTALVNLASMWVTAWSTGLDAFLLGEGGMSISVALKILGLLALFAAFFSAVLLAVTSYARSFKEAQAYIIPLMLLSLAPGIVCLIPSLKFDGLLAVVPLVNIVLLARDLLESGVDPAMATVAVASTLFYIFAAIALAARIFGTDAILYGSQATWADLFRRPRQPRLAASLSVAVACLALIFPVFFIGSNVLVRTAGVSEAARLLTSALVTVVCFGVVPWMFARHNRVQIATGMRFLWPGSLVMGAAVLLGATLWPLAFEIHMLNEFLGIKAFTGEHFVVVQELLEAWRAVPLVLILICLGVVPGIFEELFFRGFLFAALRTRLSPAKTVVASALLFGLFHVVSGSMLTPERFLPSMFLGLLLGSIAALTGSVFPAMLVHAIHNCLLLSLAYYQDELVSHGWNLSWTGHLPAGWIFAALVGLVVGFALIWLAPRPKVGEPVTQAGRMV